MGQKKVYHRMAWHREGERRFGHDYENWKFVCPKCGRVNTGAEFKAAGANLNAMYSECIGRYISDTGCDWTSYGLFDICTTHVDGQPVFDFADEEVV